MFAGRNMCIATMHKKETVIAPLLEQKIGVNCFTCTRINTDLIGSFSGEYQRLVTPLEAARQKCLQAINICKCEMAVSSEGSFGTHPVIGFVPCDEEIIFFYDKMNDLEIVVKELSTETNFYQEEVSSFEELKKIAKKVQFPSHGLILKDQPGNIIAKGINDWQTLHKQFKNAIRNNVSIGVETDMRAHFNPTRMLVIKKCTRKLVKALKSVCPKCKRPGFIVNETESGLPCECCDLPTRSTLKHIKICKGCGYRDEILYPHQKRYEEATYCDFCNP